MEVCIPPNKQYLSFLSIIYSEMPGKTVGRKISFVVIFRT